MDRVIHKCVIELETQDILEACHSSSYSRHHGGVRTTTKVLQSRFYWPNLDKNVHDLVKYCTQCQIQGGISRRHEMPLKPNLKIELFDVSGIDFMVFFESSYGNKNILVVINYV